MIAKQPSRPVIRYHGAKYKLAPWIVSNLPEHRIYCEPYGGSAAVLLAKPSCYSEVYNEMNGDVVNLFRILRTPDKAWELRRRLYLTPYAREEFEQAYRPSDDEIEQARNLIIRCFMGFSSAAHTVTHPTGFRANSNRSGTVPAKDWANYPQAITQFVERLQGVLIENKPALEVIRQHDTKETLFYCDPPYLHQVRKAGRNADFATYGKFEMTDDDHRELASVLHSVKGMVVLSGYASPLYDDLYAEWQQVKKETYADGARPRTEVLWLNPAAATKGTQGELFG